MGYFINCQNLQEVALEELVLKKCYYDRNEFALDMRICTTLTSIKIDKGTVLLPSSIKKLECKERGNIANFDDLIHLETVKTDKQYYCEQLAIKASQNQINLTKLVYNSDYKDISFIPFTIQSFKLEGKLSLNTFSLLNHNILVDLDINIDCSDIHNIILTNFTSLKTLSILNTDRQMMELSVPSQLMKIRLLNVTISNWNTIDPKELKEVYLGHSIDIVSYDLSQFINLHTIVCINECQNSKQIYLTIPPNKPSLKIKGNVKISDKLE